MKTILHSATLFAAGFLCCSLGQLQAAAQDEVRARHFILVDADVAEVGRLVSDRNTVKLTLGRADVGQAAIESDDGTGKLLLMGQGASISADVGTGTTSFSLSSPLPDTPHRFNGCLLTTSSSDTKRFLVSSKYDCNVRLRAMSTGSELLMKRPKGHKAVGCTPNECVESHGTRGGETAGG
jgi:hypothetical protein